MSRETLSPSSGEVPLDAIYARRFEDRHLRPKEEVWQEIGVYLQRFVPEDGRILDIACDRGYFTRNVHAAERWATDLRDCRAYLPEDVTFVQHDGLSLDERLPNDYFDLVFMSNYLEHLPDSNAVIRQLEVAYRLLRPDGRVLILQPNIRLVGPAYWDFIDHRVALTEKSLREATELAGLVEDTLIRRFLPYSTKSRLPQDRRIVRAYLGVPVLWRVFGKQTLYLGHKPADTGEPAPRSISAASS